VASAAVVKPHIDWWPVERLHELQAFIEDHWRRGHVLARDAGLLHWQHDRPSDAGRLSVLVAEHPVQGIVGMVGIIPFEACVMGADHRGGWMTNWLVVSEHRGRGLGLGLLRRALEDLDLVGALAGNERTQRVLGRFGFENVTMARWVRVFSVEALERLLGERAGSYPAAAWAAWREQAHHGALVSGARLWSGGGRWDAAWERFAPRLVGAKRDEAHICRRLVEHPRFRYTVLVADGPGGEPAGLAAYRIEEVRDSEARVMRIVEMLAEDEDAGRALAGALAEAARSEAVVLADFPCTSDRFGRPLAAIGFVLEETLPAALPGRFQPLDFSDRPLVCSFWASRHVVADRGKLFRTPALYVTRSDSDLDRPSS
jgi:RimJ/RimL family protein N-acetyltransferase